MATEPPGVQGQKGAPVPASPFQGKWGPLPGPAGHTALRAVPPASFAGTSFTVWVSGSQRQISER